MRDAYGRAKVAAPSAIDDIATKGYIDGLAGYTAGSNSNGEYIKCNNGLLICRKEFYPITQTGYSLLPQVTSEQEYEPIVVRYSDTHTWTYPVEPIAVYAWGGTAHSGGIGLGPAYLPIVRGSAGVTGYAFRIESLGAGLFAPAGASVELWMVGTWK